MVQQIFKDREFAMGELDLLAAQPHPSRRRVKPQIACLQHRRPGSRTSATQCPQPRDEHRVRERLGQVVISAGVQALDLVPDAVLGGQHQDRRPITFAAQRLAHLVPVGSGQHDVENDRVERVFARHPDAVGAVVHDIDSEAFGLQPLAQPGGQARLVFDHQ